MASSNPQGVAASYEAGQIVNGRQICGAKTKSGKPCGQHPMQGRTRCKLHGGATPRGFDLPQTKTGRFSKHLPTRLLADYEAALADPNLLSVREDIATLTARQADLLKRVDSGEAGELWKDMRVAVRALRESILTKDPDMVRGAMGDLEAAVLAGNSDYTAWRELMAVTEQVRKLRETERKLLEAHNATITADQALLIVSSLTAAVREHVSDQRARDAIARAVERAIGQQRTVA